VWDWTFILVLYVIGLGFFQFLGGFRAAANAIESWGRASSSARARRVSPSS
jgi:hypothetical protein